MGAAGVQWSKCPLDMEVCQGLGKCAKMTRGIFSDLERCPGCDTPEVRSVRCSGEAPRLLLDSEGDFSGPVSEYNPTGQMQTPCLCSLTREGEDERGEGR